MKKINNISSIEGRYTIVKIFKELRFDKQMSSLSSLFTLWKLCTYEKELFRYSSQNITVLHPLGFFKGTGVWLEEIVNRFYYSSINSFVYLGAALLLVLIGLRRFSNYITDNVVIAGVVIEALLLFLLFFVMFHTPIENIEEIEKEENNSQDSIDELLLEIGEISRDFASVSVNFTRMQDSFSKIIETQKELIESISENTKLNLQALNPNTQMLEIMKDTNHSLNEFNNKIQSLNSTLEKVKSEEIELTVKNEISNIIKSLSKDS